MYERRMFRAGCGQNDCTPELIEEKGLSIHMYACTCSP